MRPIQTSRLLLRDVEARDADGIAAMWAKPENTKYVGGPRDHESVRASVIRDAAANDDKLRLWPVLARDSGRLVGTCGFVEKNVDGTPEVELVYFLDYTFWGLGYATEIGLALLKEAGAARGLRRVIALIDPENLASERVAEKLGMNFERETVRPNGKRMRLFAVRIPAVPPDS
ncbi:MAG: GNAT family N-acetyltransferase [Elusimicrobia bacterium]|nr:GNAT family N-acetyltransferase [Elusimicrobiota bacterium]